MYNKRFHGFSLVETHLNRNLASDDFLKDVDSILLKTDSLELEKTVLLGDVDNGHRIPKWFPFRVQYHLSGCEQKVNNLVLIVDRLRCIFLLTGHAHDLATIFARHSHLHPTRLRANGPNTGDHKCEVSPIT